MVRCPSSAPGHRMCRHLVIGRAAWDGLTARCPPGRARVCHAKRDGHWGVSRVCRLPRWSAPRCDLIGAFPRWPCCPPRRFWVPQLASHPAATHHSPCQRDTETQPVWHKTAVGTGLDQIYGPLAHRLNLGPRVRMGWVSQRLPPSPYHELGVGPCSPRRTMGPGSGRSTLRNLTSAHSRWDNWPISPGPG
jgi:hypothetical protein